MFPFLRNMNVFKCEKQSRKNILSINKMFIFITMLFLVNSGFVYCGLSDANNKSSITFVFTGEDNGYLKPCGCTKGQLGGLKRRSVFIDSLINDENVIIPVNLGDIAGDIINRQNEIKVEIALRAMNRMNYVVHNLGEKDIALGVDLLRYLGVVYNTTFISSNIRNGDLLEDVVVPYLVKDVKMHNSNVKIGFLGVLSPELLDYELHDFEVLDPFESLKPYVRELREEVDFLILLSHSEIEEAVNLSERFPEIDLVISGHDMDEPVVSSVKDKRINVAGSPGRYGKYAGVVTLSAGQIKETDRKKTDLHMEMVPLGETFNKESRLDDLLYEYKNIVKNENLLVDRQRAKLDTDGAFTGSMVCGTCHTETFLHWKETRHAHAYETLVKDGDQFDPECVKCHVVGYEYFTGFESKEKSLDLAGVGCESCHGFGNAHVLEVSEPYGIADESACVKCHDPENSPEFEFKSYWGKIKHPVKIEKKDTNINNLKN